MEKYFIIALCIFAIYVLYYIIHNLVINKKIEDCLKINSANYNFELIRAKKKVYDYLLKSEDINVYVKVLMIPKHSQITINAIDTWRLSWSTFKTDVGKSYINDRYLDEIKSFLGARINIEKKNLKLIFLYREAESIVRYLNETELDVIDIDKTPYGYKITSFNHFSEDIKKIIKF